MTATRLVLDQDERMLKTRGSVLALIFKMWFKVVYTEAGPRTLFTIDDNGFLY